MKYLQIKIFYSKVTKYLIINYVFMATDINISSDWRMQLFWSIWLLIIVLIITIVTYMYNSSLENTKTELLSEISIVETDINVLNSNREISVYNLIDLNNVFLADLEKKSDINNIVTNISELWKDFGIAFWSFYYRWWDVVLEASSNIEWSELAYTKISKFIWNFRSENDEIFTLWHVSNFNGRNAMKFNINFKLK